MRFKPVYTVMFFDEDMEFLAESPELETYKLAEVIGQVMAAMDENIGYYTIEKYFKKIDRVESFRD